MKNNATVIHVASATLFLGGAALAASEGGSLKTAKGKIGAALCTAGVLLEGAFYTGLLGSLFGQKEEQEVVKDVDTFHAVSDADLVK